MAAGKEQEGRNQDNNNVAEVGSNALIDLNDGDRLIFVRVHPSATIKIGNIRCSLSPLIDSPYGSSFELQRGPKGPFLARIPSAKKSSHAQSNDGDSVVLHGHSDVPSVSDVALGNCDVASDRHADVKADDAIPHDQGSVETEYVIRDNRSLVDNNTAQKLSAQDIQQMRTEYASGKDIVKALVANSATFHTKTAYSQEKYKKKKQKKYAPCFVLRRPSARRVCEAYFSKTPQKIGFLRMDTMSLMLSLANVGPYGEVLVMDMVGGLLTAAIAERIGGFGSVLSVYYTNKPPPLDIVGLLNLSNSMASRVLRASIWEISSALKRDGNNETDAFRRASSFSNNAGKAVDSDTDAETKGRNGAENAIDGDMHVENEEKIHAGNTMDGDMHVENEERTNAVNILGDMHVENQDASKCQEGARTMVLGNDDNDIEAFIMQDKTGMNNGKHGTRQSDVKRDNSEENEIVRPGRSPSPLEICQWAKHGFTSLLVAALEVDPCSIIQELLPFLSPSSPFVIYHRYLQPLAQCMHELQVSKMAIGLEIVEPWLREYQVLPSRTHPHMQMHATGGYILTGIKLASQ